MNEKDIGQFYTTNGEDIWQLITFCDLPTATLENVRTGDRRGGAVGCRNLEPFIKLVPEKEIKK